MEGGQIKAVLAWHGPTVSYPSYRYNLLNHVASRKFRNVRFSFLFDGLLAPKPNNFQPDLTGSHHFVQTGPLQRGVDIVLA